MKGLLLFGAACILLVPLAVALSSAPIAATAVCFPPATSEPQWRRISAPLHAEFPRDHGAHLDTKTEWWYVTGEVQDARGRMFGVQVTIFRAGLDPSAPQLEESSLRARHALSAHVVLVDLAEKKTLVSQRSRRLGDGLSGVSTTDLDAWVEDVAIRRGADGVLNVSVSAREHAFALQLRLVPEKALVLHGDGGVSHKGHEPGQASAYASFTRLGVSGGLTLRGESTAVTGSAWFDHEWSSSTLPEGVIGWDWFGVHLDDGRDLMLFQMRAATPSVPALRGGTLVERDGSTRALRPAELEFKAGDTWLSPRSSAAYPLKWRVDIPALELALEIQARMPDCEIDGRRTTGSTYWEGPVEVRGRGRAGATISGRGYGEFVGYAPNALRRF